MANFTQLLTYFRGQATANQPIQISSDLLASKGGLTAANNLGSILLNQLQIATQTLTLTGIPLSALPQQADQTLTITNAGQVAFLDYSKIMNIAELTLTLVSDIVQLSLTTILNPDPDTGWQFETSFPGLAVAPELNTIISAPTFIVTTQDLDTVNKAGLIFSSNLNATAVILGAADSFISHFFDTSLADTPGMILIGNIDASANLGELNMPQVTLKGIFTTSKPVHLFSTNFEVSTPYIGVSIIPQTDTPSPEDPTPTTYYVPTTTLSMNLMLGTKNILFQTPLFATSNLLYLSIAFSKAGYPEIPTLPDLNSFMPAPLENLLPDAIKDCFTYLSLKEFNLTFSGSTLALLYTNLIIGSDPAKPIPLFSGLQVKSFDLTWTLMFSGGSMGQSMFDAFTSFAIDGIQSFDVEITF